MVAKIALQHHEFSNGSGYPYGISMQQIPIEVAIVCVCNFFDNLTSNKTKFKISNTREALKTMIKMGSQYFKADVLYAFVNMFSYNDTKNFTQMMV